MPTVAMDGWCWAVERGPNWLIIHLKQPPEQMQPAELAQQLWQVIDRHFTYRVILDLSGLPNVCSWLLGELIRLRRRIADRNGVLRLCGLSEQDQSVLRLSRLDQVLPYFDSCREAVWACPQKPR